MRSWTLLAIGVATTLALAGCFEIYESGSETPIECEEVPPDEVRPGAPNPLRCVREESEDGANASSENGT